MLSLTLTVQPDSSKLDKKPWVINGLNCSGPVASKQHASHSLDETSKIEGTTETEMVLTLSESDISP